PVYVDDGRIRLRVREVVGDEVRTDVEEGGHLTSHKGINLPGVRVSSPSITAKDAEDVAFGVRDLAVDYVALSFVRSGADVRRGVELVRGLGSRAGVVAKIEKPEALDDLDAVLAASDAVMVARGDLG